MAWRWYLCCTGGVGWWQFQSQIISAQGKVLSGYCTLVSQSSRGLCDLLMQPVKMDENG